MGHGTTILRFLAEHPAKWFDDDQLSDRLGIRPRQTVNQVCRALHERGEVRRELRNGKLVNTIGLARIIAEPETAPAIEVAPTSQLSPYEFEKLAREAVTEYFQIPVQPGKLPGVPKLFDIVSADHTVVGDAKYFTLVHGEYLPPAKFSIIAEHVWLLEKCTEARHRLLVFGNERQVPVEWLKRYGGLARSVQFFFLTRGGQLEPLMASDSVHKTSHPGAISPEATATVQPLTRITTQNRATATLHCSGSNL
jgi:hypothetical protein